MASKSKREYVPPRLRRGTSERVRGTMQHSDKRRESRQQGKELTRISLEQTNVSSN